MHMRITCLCEYLCKEQGYFYRTFMKKKDVMYVVIAFCIIIVIALVIKPIMTGKPVNTGISGTPSPQPTPFNVTPNYSAVTTKVTQIITISTTKPTPVPYSTVNVIQFVDPATYGISLNESYRNIPQINSSSVDFNRTTIAEITGQYSSTTQVFYIPFPYWELEYTVEPATAPATSSFSIVSSPTLLPGEKGSSHSGISGSYSTARSEFTIQVIDADNPTRLVRTITPPGGIDLDLWKGIKSTNPTAVPTTPKYTTTVAVVIPIIDPRPWTEKFYEGGRNYFFIIDAQSLDSYEITINVPTRYIGKY